MLPLGPCGWRYIEGTISLCCHKGCVRGNNFYNGFLCKHLLFFQWEDITFVTAEIVGPTHSGVLLNALKNGKVLWGKLELKPEGDFYPSISSFDKFGFFSVQPADTVKVRQHHLARQEKNQKASS